MSQYFWINGEVIEHKEDEESPREFRDKYCLDDDIDGLNDSQWVHCRYGRYSSKGGWEHIPYEEFPAEFRALLLLKGLK